MLFGGGTMGRRQSDDGRAGDLADNTGREVTAFTVGDHRPGNAFTANHMLGICDMGLNCSGVEKDAAAYAEQVRTAAREGGTGKVDIVAASYSAHEMLIMLEMHPDVADSIDRLLLVGPTQVRDSAARGLSIDIRVVAHWLDHVFWSPYPNGGVRLHPADTLRKYGAEVDWVILDSGIVLDPVAVHDGWFGSNPAMTQELWKRVAEL